MAELGFSGGARTLFSAFRRVAGTPTCWPYALVPSLVLTLLAGTAVASVFAYARPALDSALGTVTSVEWFNELLVWVAVLGSALLSIFAALIITTPLSAPALERLVAQTERALGVPERAPLGFVREMWCGLRAQAAPLLWTVPAWLALLLVDAVAPFLAPLTFALRAVLTSVGVAWALFDYPLTLRGVGIRQRLSLLRRCAKPVLGFGAAFALLFWLPCCGIAFLGVGVVGATELLVKLSERDPFIREVLASRAVP